MNYYQLFDLKPSLAIDRGELRSKYLQLSREYHPDRFVDATLAEQEKAIQLITLINKAYTVLDHEDKNLSYLLSHLKIIVQDEKYNLPQSFLMEMLEMNEELNFSDEIKREIIKGDLIKRKGELKETIKFYLAENQPDEVRLAFYQLKYIDRLLKQD